MAAAVAATAAFISAPAQHYPGAVAVGGDGVVARGRHSVAFFLDLYRRRRRRRRRGMRSHSSTPRRYFEIDSGQAGRQAGRSDGRPDRGGSIAVSYLFGSLYHIGELGQPAIQASRTHTRIVAASFIAWRQFSEFDSFNR